MINFKIQNDKFHRIIYKKISIRNIKPEDQTIRNLLCIYSSLSSKHYEDATYDMYLANHYDVNNNVGLSSVGNKSIITQTISFVDPKYIDDESYNMNTIKEVIDECASPMIINNNFSKKLFKKAKDIYTSDLLYLSESSEKTAYQNAIDIYFNGTNRAFDPSGDLVSLSKISCKKLYNYYLKTLKDETVSYIIGDVGDNFTFDNNPTCKLYKNYVFKDRCEVKNYISVKEDIDQAYIYMIYDSKCFINSNKGTALMAFNYLFGGNPNSSLFRIVREKYGLCYSVSSTYLGATGVLIVKIITDKENVKKAIEATKEAFNSSLDDMNLDSIKEYYRLINLEKKDYMENEIYNHFYNAFFYKFPSNDDEIINVNKLKKSDIKKAMESLELKFTYVYGGKEDE